MLPSSRQGPARQGLDTTPQQLSSALYFDLSDQICELAQDVSRLKSLQTRVDDIVGKFSQQQRIPDSSVVPFNLSVQMGDLAQEVSRLRNLQKRVEDLDKKFSQQHNEIDSLKEVISMMTKKKQDGATETESNSLKNSNSKEIAQDFPVVANIQRPPPKEEPFQLPTPMGDSSVATTKKQNAERKDSHLQTTKGKEIAEPSAPAVTQEPLERRGLNPPQTPGKKMSKEVQVAFHGNYESQRSLLDSPNPETGPAITIYRNNKVGSSQQNIVLLLPVNAKPDLSMKPKSLASVPSGRDPNDNSIHGSKRLMQTVNQELRLPGSCDTVHAQSGTVKKSGRGQLQGGQDEVRSSQITGGIPEQSNSRKLLIPPGTRAKKPTEAVPPLVPKYDARHDSQSLCLPEHQLTETSHAIPETPVKTVSSVSSTLRDSGLSITATRPVYKNQGEAVQLTNDTSTSSQHRPTSIIMESKDQDQHPDSKNVVVNTPKTDEDVFEQLLAASKDFEKRSIARKEAAKLQIAKNEAAKHEAAKYEVAKNETAKNKVAQVKVPLKEALEALEIVELPESRKPTYTRVLGSALDEQVKTMVLKPSVQDPTPPVLALTLTRPFHFKFQRILAKVLDSDGKSITIGHLDGNTSPYVELSMHLHVTKDEATSVKLEALITSINTDFNILQNTPTRVLLDFSMHFDVPGLLEKETITLKTVPIAEETEFTPSSPIGIEIQKLRDRVKNELQGNLRQISFAFTENDYAVPDPGSLADPNQLSKYFKWHNDVINPFDFMAAFNGEERKFLTILFTDEHPTEEVDEMMRVLRRNCNLQEPVWHDRGLTWQSIENETGDKKWLLKSEPISPVDL